VSIGKNCRITRAVIDKACVIEDGMVIGEDLEEDRKRFFVTDKGIVLVTPEMLGQHLYVVKENMQPDEVIREMEDSIDSSLPVENTAPA